MRRRTTKGEKRKENREMTLRRCSNGEQARWREATHVRGSNTSFDTYTAHLSIHTAHPATLSLESFLRSQTGEQRGVVIYLILSHGGQRPSSINTLRENRNRRPLIWAKVLLKFAFRPTTRTCANAGPLDINQSFTFLGPWVRPPTYLLLYNNST